MLICSTELSLFSIFPHLFSENTSIDFPNWNWCPKEKPSKKTREIFPLSFFIHPKTLQHYCLPQREHWPKTKGQLGAVIDGDIRGTQGPCVTAICGLFTYWSYDLGKNTQNPLLEQKLAKNTESSLVSFSDKTEWSFSCNDSRFDKNVSFSFCQLLPVVFMAAQLDLDSCNCQNEWDGAWIPLLSLTALGVCFLK